MLTGGRIVYSNAFLAWYCSIDIFPQSRCSYSFSLGSRGRLHRDMANDMAEASERRNIRQLGVTVTDPPRSPSPKFLQVCPRVVMIGRPLAHNYHQASSVNDPTQDCESYPMGTLSSRHDSYRTDGSTLVAGSTHTP
jgi:hypothetical protein